MTTAAPARYRDVFASTEFRALYGAFTLQVLGETVKMLALSVLVFDRTGSSLAAAVAFMAGMLPYAVGGVLFLSLADRMSPRRLLVAFHLFRLVLTVVLATGGLPIPAAIALMALSGLFGPVATASSNGLLPDLLPGDAYVLGRSLFTMTSGGAQVAGLAAGGSLLLAVGPYGTLWLTAASCLLAAIIAGLGLRDRPARSTGGGSPVRETMRVNRRLLAESRVRGLLLAQLLPISLAVGAEGVAVPYAAAVGRPGAAGVLLSALAGGMLAGNLVVGRFVSPPWRERLVLPLSLVPGAALLFFALTPGLAVAVLVGAVSAFGYCYELGLQRRFVDAVPESAQGQALGLAGTALITCQAACAMIAGGLAELWAPGTTMAVCGAASLLSAVLLVRPP